MSFVPARSKHALINAALVAFTLVALAIFGATSAHAQPDNFLNGDGHDGAVTIGTAGTSVAAVPNTVAPVSGALSAGALSLTYGTKRVGTTAPGTPNVSGNVIADYAVGRLVMIYQSNGVASAPTAGDQTAYPLSNSTAGHWEFARVTAFTATTLTFNRPLIYSYAAGTTQVIAVPEYTTLGISNAATTISAHSWDGSSGGVVAILASGAITFNQAASINANADGFRGGISYNQNAGGDTGCLTTTYNSPGNNGTYGMKGEGFYAAAYALTNPATAGQQARGNQLHAGGGGNCFNSGGGGGGNGGQGGRGGNSLVNYTDGDQQVGGLGGAALTYSAANHFAMGGGGGSGERNNANPSNGGVGGGVVFVRGASLAGAGNITANGAPGTNGNTGAQPWDGAGGGGAGGVVHMRFTGAVACGSVRANGGVGGNNSRGTGTYSAYYWTPGGGGAGGKTYLQGSSVACGANTAALGNSGTNTTNGNVYGATNGAAGTTTSNATGFSLPSVTIAAPATASFTNATPAASGTATAGSTVSIYIDEVYSGTATLVGTNWTYSVPALTAGAHTIRAYADLGGLASPSVSNSFTVDLTAPTVVLSAPANGSATNDTTPLVTFTVTETNAGTSRCIVDGVLPGTVCTTGSSLAALAPGAHTLTIQHTDLAGNVGTSATNTFTIDTTAPVAPSINSPVSPFTTNDQTPAFGGMGEPNNNVYIYVDGVLNSITFTDAGGNWTMDLGTVAPGVHSVYATTMDPAGNTSPQSAPSRSLTIDIVAPTVTVTSPASNGLTVGPNGNIAFTTSDAVGPVTTTCVLDSDPSVSCSSPFAYGSLAGGAHTFTVTATDAASNSSVAVRTFNVDNTPPNTNITANPAAVTNSTSASFSFTSTESPNTFECSLDGSPVAVCTTPQAYSSLGEGSHTFSVRAIDQYGNVDQTPASYTWSIDTTVPVTPTISTPGSDIVTSDTTPAVGGLSEPGSTVRVYEGVTLIGTAVANGSGVWALSPDPTLTAGSHTFIARATDPAGNVSSDSGPRVIVVDTTAPTVTISAPANGSTTSNTTPAITFNVVDANQAANSTCTIDGNPVTCTTGYTPTALGEGPHTVFVSHTDLAGNVGTSATHTFTVDTVAPSAPVITGGPSAPVASTTAAFTFTGEVGATYECFIDSPVAWVACTSGVSYTSLAQGPHTFYVRQIDAAGNVSPEASRSWSVDTVGPPAPSVSGPSGTVGTSSATIDFNDLESPVTYMCSLDGAPASLCTSPVNLTGLSDAPHSYAVYAVDTLGNAGPATTINWTVDSSLFTAGITDGPLGTVATSNNSLSFTATIVSGTTYMCRVDAAAFASCTSPILTGALPDGSHTFEVYAVNGSQNSATVSRTWTIDTAGPILSITAPTNLQTVGPNGNVTFTATDAAGPITYTCQIDGGSATACGSPYVFSGLTDGAHSVTVVATDGVGNNSVQVRNFIVDATPPQTTITANPPSSTNSTSPAFSFISSEVSSTFECSIDGGPIGLCTSPTNYAGLSESSHTFAVRAIDQYGNVDQTPATYTWTIDLTAPTAPSINTPATDIVTSDTTPAIAGLAEANSTVRVYEGVTLIGTATANGSGAWSLSPDPTFTEGPHALVARSTDSAGNTSVNSGTRTITVDLTPPVVNITSPTEGSVTNDDTPDIVFTATDTNLTLVQCSVDGSAPVTCSSAWTTPSLSEGLHVVQVLAADGTGSPAVVDTVTFVVDTIAPDEPVINTPANDISTQNLRPTISGIAEPDSEITVYDGATAIGTTTTNGSGAWSFTPTSDLSEAAHPLHVTATDEAGNTSDDSNIRTITIDLTAPSAPSINSPATDITTNIVRPTIGGLAEADSEVTVYDGATSIGTATADGSGNWTFTPSSDLSAGEHDFHVTATDEAGNTSGDSNIRTITIDVTAPDAPEITTPAQDLTTAVNVQPISGTAEANSTVTVYDGATQIGTATADGNGDWSLSPDPTFLAGSHAITAWATDAAGNTSNASEIRTITIDNTAPLAPEINSPSSGDHLSNPSPTISGIGESDTTIEVFDGPTLICTATVDSFGNWSCTPSTPLGEGDHTLTAKSTDPSGNESPASDDVDVTVDTTSPSVLISSPAASSTVATHTPSVSFTATDDNLNTVECRTDTDLTWVACSAPWTTPSLPDGPHVVEVRATDEAGNVNSTSVAFIVDTTAPVTTIASTPGAQSNNTTPTFTFSVTGGPATAECRVLPDAFAPCNSPFTTGTLAPGTHTFEVRSTDSHGNIEAPAKSYTWNVDTAAPIKPVVTAPGDNSTTGDNTPTISGTAEINSTVEVFVDGNSLGTVTANGSGQWTIPSTSLLDGLHTVTATATDAANNTGPSADTIVFRVDTTPPVGTVTPQPGTGGGSEAPTYDIQTDGPSTITCSVDGAPANPCTSPYKPSGTFAPGTHTILVTFTDPIGNVSTRTITFVIAAPPAAKPSTPADSDPLPAACFAKGIAISNIAVVGGKVKVSGFARLSYVGKTVSLTYKPTGVKVLATATVGVDGAFSVSTKAPAANLRLSNKTLYRVTVADESTPWTKLARRVASSTATYKNGKLVVSGQLSKPLMPNSPVTITARTGCNGPWSTITKGKVKSNGAFSTSTSYKVSTGVVFVRVAAVVSKGGAKPKALRTYSFVMPVVLR